MTKENLVAAVLKNAKCETKKQAHLAVGAVFEAITKSLSRREEVSIAGFGIFRAIKVRARMGINPKTRQKIQIPASIKPKFKAGKALKDAVK